MQVRATSIHSMNEQFPSLYNRHTPAYVREAYDKLKEGYHRANNLLGTEEPDAIRLKIVADNLENLYLPLINALQRMREVPRFWIDGIAEILAAMVICLRSVSSRLQEIGFETNIR